MKMFGWEKKEKDDNLKLENVVKTNKWQFFPKCEIIHKRTLCLTLIDR